MASKPTQEGMTLRDPLALRGWKAALNSQTKSVPIGWITDDYLTDKSATTYSKEVAERWISKGWDVQPIYAAPQQADKVRELEKDAAIGRLVRSKLISCNNVPVSRCHINADEVQAIDQAMKGE